MILAPQEGEDSDSSDSESSDRPAPGAEQHASVSVDDPRPFPKRTATALEEDGPPATPPPHDVDRPPAGGASAAPGGLLSVDHEDGSSSNPQLFPPSGSKSSTYQGLFILLKGEVEVLKEGQVIAVLTSGETFGEVFALGLRKDRVATIRAKTLCDTLCIEKSALDAALSEFPEERSRIQRVALARLEDLRNKTAAGAAPIHGTTSWIGGPTEDGGGASAAPPPGADVYPPVGDEVGNAGDEEDYFGGGGGAGARPGGGTNDGMIPSEEGGTGAAVPQRRKSLLARSRGGRRRSSCVMLSRTAPSSQAEEGDPAIAAALAIASLATDEAFFEDLLEKMVAENPEDDALRIMRVKRVMFLKERLLARKLARHTTADSRAEDERMTKLML